MDRVGGHLFVSVGALRATERLALPLAALVPRGALGAWPVAEHRRLHVSRDLSLHLLEAPSERKGREKSKVSDRGVRKREKAAGDTSRNIHTAHETFMKL